MNDAEIERFIMHYERLTRWMIREMPARADGVFFMNPDRAIVESSA
jgi:D-glycerate 3-kinase